MAVRRVLVFVALLAASVVTVPSTTTATAAAAVGSPAEGEVVSFGDAVPVFGAAGDDAVDVAATRTGAGWWATDPAGVVTAAGDARHHGSAPAVNAPVLTIAATPGGGGYWLTAADGGVFTFGDAPFLGSTGAMRLNQPVVTMARTPTGRGYWLVAADGGVFTFGDAPFLGSTGGLRLNAPIVAMAPTASGRGYWLVASDGGVFTFGDASFAGSAAGSLAAPVTDAAAAPGGGYWVLAGDGTVQAFGGARHVGDAAGAVRNGTAVGLVPSPTGGGYRFAVGRTRDLLTVWQPGGLRDDTQGWAEGVARAAGASYALRHRVNLDLDATNGWRIPMALVTYEPGAARAVIGPSADAALARRQVVVGAAAARRRHVAVGSTMTFLDGAGRTHQRTVGAVVPDERLAWAELGLATSDAASIGLSRPFAIDIWGASRASIEGALAAAPGHRHVLGIIRSWLPSSPDDTLPNEQLKAVVGEPAYRHGAGDAVALDPAWVRANIATESVPGLGRVTCHRAVLPALRGALTEVARAGLGGGLGRFGGCYNPRLIRGGDSGGFLSRHSYGIAVDVNTANNTFGGRVSMDPRIVDIFHRWGFAWGGTWTRPDGMHFEYAPG
jgi:hypothetical protein